MNVCFKAHSVALDFSLVLSPFIFKQDLVVPLCTDTGIIFLACTSSMATVKENVTGKCLNDKGCSKLFCLPTILAMIPAVVVFLFTQHHLIIYITTCNHAALLSNFGCLLALLRLCYCFVIVFPILNHLAFSVDNVHANTLVPLYRLSLYVSFLP